MLEKTEDPFETLKELLKDFHFEVSERKILGTEALQEARRRGRKILG